MEATKEPHSLFERLPHAALVNMLRFFSQAPEAEGWAGRVLDATKLSIVAEGHPLKKAAENEPNQLMFFQFGDEVTEEEGRLLAAFGSTCTSLSMSAAELIDFDSLLTSYSFPKLKKISMSNLPSDFESFSMFMQKQRSLEELLINRRAWSLDMPDALSQRGPGLKKLALSTDLSCGEELTRMFDSIGSTLLSLKIVFRQEVGDLHESTFDIKSLAQSCPQLTDLSVGWLITHLREDEIALYALYGPQLQLVHLSGMDFPRSFLRTLSDSCPNVALDLSDVSCDVTPMLDTLGARISGLRLSDNVAPTGALTHAAADLTRLESLATGARNVCAIFEHPKTRLRSLILHSDEHVDDFDAAVAAIARSSGALVDVKVSCDGIGLRALEEFALSNALLEDVQLFYMVPEGADEDVFRAAAMVDLVSAFVGCKMLRVLHLKVIPIGMPDGDNARIAEVDDACVPYRSRNVSVRFDDVEYNPLCRV